MTDAAGAGTLPRTRPRETMRGQPRVLQPFLTWVTGVPLTGSAPRVRWRPGLAAAAGVAQTAAGIAIGALGLKAGGFAMVPLVLLAWPIIAGGMRRLDVVVVHQTLHNMFAASAGANRVMCEIITTLLWRPPYDGNREEHLLHHAHPCSLRDGDTGYLMSTGARPGMTRRECRRYLVRAVFSPRHHWSFFSARVRANLFARPPAYRLVMALAYLAATVAFLVLSGMWPAWLLLWFVPATFFFQNQTFLYTLSEHRWWLFGNAERLTKAQRDQLTFARFCGEPLPERSHAGGLRHALAVTAWWARTVLVYAPYRLCILVGDTVQHDLHHIRPRCDWANSSWERNEELSGARAERFFEVWGGLLSHVYVGNSVRDTHAWPSVPPTPGVSAAEPRVVEPATERRPDTSVLLIDGTGRGHALCGLFVRTDPAVTVYYGPGCDVIDHPRIHCVPSISVHDPRTALEFLAAHPVEFVFVSYIDALTAGFVDELRRAGHQVIGPSAAAALLEASKARGKEFCTEHGIPVPEHQVFTDLAEAREYIRSRPYPCVVKADGLTPDGDGSVVCATAAEAEEAAGRLAAGGLLPIVVEERLTGPEISVFALLDGNGAMMLPPALDYKRTLEGDEGKNCDGMGSIAPHPADSPALREMLRSVLVDRFVRGVRAERLDFTGFVYLGAVLTDRGPIVIEINARFGDSEAQVVLPGLRENFTGLCRAVLAGRLDRGDACHDGQVRCSVALVQGYVPGTDPGLYPGWPFGAFAAGQPVSGLGPAGAMANVFYANLRRDGDGRPVTSGGRVLHVVGAGESLADAREMAYRDAARIGFPGVRYRGDIGAVLPRAWPADDPVIVAGSPVRSGVVSAARRSA